MTDAEKQRIQTFRTNGMGYASIADTLKLKETTVKMFCLRNHIGEQRREVKSENNYELCRECGKPLIQIEKQKKRVFCSDVCRNRWWHKHPDQIHQKAVYTYHCLNCGASFSAYGNSQRKYCSHACYIDARFHKAGERA